MKEKNVWIAIGLNFIFLGSGYYYIGRKVVGIILMIFLILLVGAGLLLPPGGLSEISGLVFIFFIVSVIDLLIYGYKIKKQNSKKCPFCAEEIKKEAIVCMHCKKDIAREAS